MLFRLSIGQYENCGKGRKRVNRARFDYNPTSPETIDDPYPVYGQLRSERPVHHNWRLDAWVFACYDDIDKILRDHHRFSSDPSCRTLNRRQRSSLPGREEYTLVFMDPPEHTQLRAILGKLFTRRLVNRLAPYIQSRMNALLDQDGK